MKKGSLAVLLFVVIAAKGQVAGKVVNENNGAVPYATVAVKNGSLAVSTDSSGRFSFASLTQFPVTLLFTSSGYNPRERTIRSATDDLLVQLELIYQRDTIVVTSRRRSERIQDVPIPVSVITGAQMEESGSFNVNRVKEFVPSVQLYSSNPRNTGINIRGLGSPFGLTNDGLDPGVGFYVDGVYYARPAAATLDFIDVERIEVLRGPQGTLFGKNTTAGAFNIITRKPQFSPEARFEVSYGNYGYVQAKSTITGPLSRKLAARLSFSGTQRDGVLKNIRSGKSTNDVNNLGFHGQLLYKPGKKTAILLSGDATRQRPDGYAQVIAGVVKTERPDYRQFAAILSDLHYSLPSYNAFDRVIDHDTPWNSDNDMGGVSLNVEKAAGAGTFTSTTAWRYWDWNPSNDRDFTGLQALAKSQNPSKHRNWSQEFRYAGQLYTRVSGVVGLFLIDQEVKTSGTEESGKDQWRFAQNTTSEKWKTPGLFEGYGARTNSSIQSLSAAAFANVDWQFAQGFHLLPGLRYNYDKKEVRYNRSTYGGLETSDPDLIALKQGLYRDQAFTEKADEKNLTYQLTLSYRPNQRIHSYITYSTSYKPIGVNVGGLPTVNGEADLSLAVIKPEYVKQVEIGFKSTLVESLTLNFSLFNTDIDDYQANVQSPQLGVNRGYLANAEKVNVKGLELDGQYLAGRHFTCFAALSYTDGRYVRFSNAPLPLEETGLTKDGVQVAFKDISGKELPGISRWAGSYGGEFTTPAAFIGKAAKFFVAVDGYFRSSFSSSPTPSKYLNVPGYALLNARLGYRVSNGLTAFVWGRNILDKDYYEQLLPAGGNAGQYAAVLGDPVTYGVTLSYRLK